MPWTRAHQAPMSMRFARQEYRSELPFPSLEYLPGPEIKPVSSKLVGGFFTTESPGKSRDETESVILKLRTNKFQDQMASEAILPNKGELTPILLKLLQKTEEGGTLPKTLSEATITLIPIPDKDTTKKENHRLLSLMNIDVKILIKTLAN